MKRKKLFILLALISVLFAQNTDKTPYAAKYLQPGAPEDWESHPEITVMTTPMFTSLENNIFNYFHIVFDKSQTQFQTCFLLYESIFGQKGYSKITMDCDENGLFSTNNDINITTPDNNNYFVNLTIYYIKKQNIVLYKWESDEKFAENIPGGLPIPKLIGSETNMNIGEQCPEFSTKTLKGADFNIADFKGKIIVLNWWTTWCGPCRNEIPELNKLIEKYGSTNIQFFAICDNENPEELTAYLETNEFNYDHLFSNPELQEILGTSYPQNIIIDRDFKIRFHSEGNTTFEIMDQKIQEILGD